MTFNWKICLVINASEPARSTFCHPVLPKTPFYFGSKHQPDYAEFEGTGLGPDTLRDIRILATIDRLSESLSPELAHDIQKTTASSMKAIGHMLGGDFELIRWESER
jgi:hypothetical protein